MRNRTENMESGTYKAKPAHPKLEPGPKLVILAPASKGNLILALLLWLRNNGSNVKL
jgi:hypothetical protein